MTRGSWPSRRFEARTEGTVIGAGRMSDMDGDPPDRPSSATRLPAAWSTPERWHRIVLQCQVTSGARRREQVSIISAATCCRPGAERRARHRLDPGTGRVHTDQVVPTAGVTHFDHVTDDRVLPSPVAGEFGMGRHAAPPGGKAGTEDEGHVHQLGLFADRARGTGGQTKMPGCPEQFRMGVTHIELGQPTLAVLTDDGFSGESVLDLSSGRGCLHTSEPSRSEAHVSQGNPSPVRKGTYSDDFPATDSRVPTPDAGGARSGPNPGPAWGRRERVSSRWWSGPGAKARGVSGPTGRHPLPPGSAARR